MGLFDLFKKKKTDSAAPRNMSGSKIAMLDHDFNLTYHSIYMEDGRAATNIFFVAATQEIVMSSWCMRETGRVLPSGEKEYSETKDERRYPVPPEIKTEADLRSYVRTKWSMYFY